MDRVTIFVVPTTTGGGAHETNALGRNIGVAAYA
jgi:hypothetical protein